MRKGLVSITCKGLVNAMVILAAIFVGTTISTFVWVTIMSVVNG